MRIPRISIGGLMVLIGGIAANFAAYRLFLLGGDLAKLAIIGVLFMANILGFSLLHIVARRGKTGPFLAGFTAFGLMSVSVYLIFITAYAESSENLFTRFVIRTSVWCLESLHDRMNFAERKGLLLAFVFVYWLGVAALFLLPHLCIAASGGWVWRFFARYKLVRQTAED